MRTSKIERKKRPNRVVSPELNIPALISALRIDRQCSTVKYVAYRFHRVSQFNIFLRFFSLSIFRLFFFPFGFICKKKKRWNKKAFKEYTQILVRYTMFACSLCSIAFSFIVSYDSFF